MQTMTGRRYRVSGVVAITPLFLLGILAVLAGCTTVEERGQDAIRATVRSSGVPGIAGAAPGPMPDLDENATIHDYLTYALLNNPGVRSAFETWRAALERVPQAKALPDPTLGYGYFIRNIETRVGPQRHRFELMQKIPFFGKLGLRGEAALAVAKAAAARYAMFVILGGDFRRI